MAWLRCPTCHQPFDSEQSQAMPFCSERCRLVDLGRWLNEDIGLPTGEAVDPLQPEQAEPPPPAPRDADPPPRRGPRAPRPDDR